CSQTTPSDQHDRHDRQHQRPASTARRIEVRMRRNATAETAAELQPVPNDDGTEGALHAATKNKRGQSTEDRLAFYVPYPKQIAFHAAGASARERLLMAGNQLGKTLAGGFEVAMHMTGRYPDWWQGKRFTKPVVGGWCGGS